jgi:hypothetical protein
LQRKRRYPLQIKRKNFSTTYQPVKGQSHFSGRKKLKIFIYLMLMIISVFIIKYIYDIQYVKVDSSSPEALDPGVIQTQEKPVQQESSLSPIPPFQRNIQIEILNACGVSGIAKIFTNYLQQQGFDVVNTDNYLEKGKIKWNLSKSKVIDKTIRPKYAEKIAEIIGIPFTQIERQENLEAISDVSVVIGMDFRKLKGFQQFKK